MKTILLSKFNDLCVLCLRFLELVQKGTKSVQILLYLLGVFVL